MYRLIVKISIAACVLSIVYWAGLYHNVRYLTKDKKFALVEPYQTTDGKIGKMLSINKSPSSFLEYKTLNGFKYIELIKKIIFYDLKLQGKDVLVLGAGGFSLSATGTYGNSFDYVDIEANLKDIVEKDFITKINGNFIAKDAKQFLTENTKKYSVIVGDTYDYELNIPQHLTNKEYFGLVNQSLLDDGFAILNIVINPMLNDKYSQGLDQAVRASFVTCMSIPGIYNNKKTNVIYLCPKKVLI